MGIILEAVLAFLKTDTSPFLEFSRGAIIELILKVRFLVRIRWGKAEGLSYFILLTLSYFP